MDKSGDLNSAQDDRALDGARAFFAAPPIGNRSHVRAFLQPHERAVKVAAGVAVAAHMESECRWTSVGSSNVSKTASGIRRRDGVGRRADVFLSLPASCQA